MSNKNNKTYDLEKEKQYLQNRLKESQNVFDSVNRNQSYESLKNEIQSKKHKMTDYHYYALMDILRSKQRR